MMTTCTNIQKFTINEINTQQFEIRIAEKKNDTIYNTLAYIDRDVFYFIHGKRAANLQKAANHKESKPNK